MSTSMIEVFLGGDAHRVEACAPAMGHIVATVAEGTSPAAVVS